MEANRSIEEFKDLSPMIKFKALTQQADMQITTFSDASFNISSLQVYGQTGIVTGINVYQHDNQILFYPINCTWTKQRRVKHLSYWAEKLAAAKTDERKFYIRNILADLSREFRLDHVLIVDSNSLFDSIATLHENSE